MPSIFASKSMPFIPFPLVAVVLLFACIAPTIISPRPPSPSQQSLSLSPEGFILDKSGAVGSGAVDSYNAIFGQALLLMEFLEDAEKTLQVNREDQDWGILRDSLDHWDKFCTKIQSDPARDVGRRRRLGRSAAGLNTRSCPEWAQLARAVAQWVLHLEAGSAQIADEIACTLREQIGAAEKLAQGEMGPLVDRSLGLVEDRFRQWGGGKRTRKAIRLDFGVQKCALAGRMLELRKYVLRPVVRGEDGQTAYSTVELMDRLIDVYVQVEAKNADAFHSGQFEAHFANKKVACLDDHLGEQRDGELGQLMAKFGVHYGQQQGGKSVRILGRSSAAPWDRASVQQSEWVSSDYNSPGSSPKHRFDQLHQQTISAKTTTSSSSSSSTRQRQSFAASESHSSHAESDYYQQKEHFEQIKAKLEEAKRSRGQFSRAELEALQRAFREAVENLAAANQYLQEELNKPKSNGRQTQTVVTSNSVRHTLEFGKGSSPTANASPNNSPPRDRHDQYTAKTSSFTSRQNTSFHLGGAENQSANLLNEFNTKLKELEARSQSFESEMQVLYGARLKQRIGNKTFVEVGRLEERFVTKSIESEFTEVKQLFEQIRHQLDKHTVAAFEAKIGEIGTLVEAEMDYLKKLVVERHQVIEAENKGAQQCDAQTGDCKGNNSRGSASSVQQQLQQQHQFSSAELANATEEQLRDEMDDLEERGEDLEQDAKSVLTGSNVNFAEFDTFGYMFSQLRRDVATFSAKFEQSLNHKRELKSLQNKFSAWVKQLEQSISLVQSSIAKTCGELTAAGKKTPKLCDQLSGGGNGNGENSNKRSSRSKSPVASPKGDVVVDFDLRLKELKSRAASFKSEMRVLRTRAKLSLGSKSFNDTCRVEEAFVAKSIEEELAHTKTLFEQIKRQIDSRSVVDIESQLEEITSTIESELSVLTRVIQERDQVLESVTEDQLRDEMDDLEERVDDLKQQVQSTLVGSKSVDQTAFGEISYTFLQLQKSVVAFPGKFKMALKHKSALKSMQNDFSAWEQLVEKSFNFAKSSIADACKKVAARDQKMPKVCAQLAEEGNGH